MDRTTRRKTSNEIEDLNNIINQLDLTDIYRTLYSTTQYKFFSSEHGIFSRIDHMLGHKLSLNRFKKTDMIQSILSNHNRINLDMNNIMKKNWKIHKFVESKQHTFNQWS